MTGRLRYLLAAAFVALFFLIPSPDGPEDRRYLAFLQVRGWLMDSGGSPFHQVLQEGRVPPVQVSLVTTPPIEDARERAEREAEYARSAREWAQARESEGKKSGNHLIRYGPELTPVPMEVRVGDDGAQATLMPPELLLPPSAAGTPYAQQVHDALEAALAEHDCEGMRAVTGLEAADPDTETAVAAFCLQRVTAEDDPARSATRPARATATVLRGEVRDLEIHSLATVGFFPVRTSLLPAFLAIVLAILSGRVIPSLLLGCIAGGMLHVSSAFGGLWHFFSDTLWVDVLGSTFNLRVTAFVIFLFMAVGVMSRSGGIQGMVQWVSRFARGPISSQVCAYVIGVLIFFDDYSNCIISGTTMRPLTDRNRVSREKLSYIVDSTAAPVAGISIFSTWIAYEVSQFRGQLPLVTDETGAAYTANDGFAVFVQTLPYRFYCIFTLMMVFLTILLRREWGPMLAAERRARREGKPVADGATPMVSKDLAELEAPAGAPLRGINAFAPVLLLVVLTVGLIYYFGAYADGKYVVPPEIEGLFERLQWIMGNSASELALMWASLAALVLAAVLAVGQRILPPREVVHSAVRSARSLFFAIVILLLAWSIGVTCGDLGTNFYLTAAFREAMNAMLLPIVMFVLSGLIAFSTGTSYGTMAILLPNVVVLAHTIGSESAIGGPGLMVLTIGAVLEGSIFGDHCSPISDTTVLSSVGTGSDHLHHVQTQAPYALLTMTVAIVCGYLPMVWIDPGLWPVSWVLGLGGMCAFLWFVARRPDA